MIRLPAELGIFAWKRMILTVTVLLIMNGMFAWLHTPQEEDPKLAERSGVVTVIYPGAMPGEIERLVTKPIEDELATIAEIKKTSSSMRADFLFMQLDLVDDLSDDYEIQNAWDKIEDALERAQTRFPESASKPLLNHEITDQHAVLLALYGSSDALSLLDQSKRLRDRLQSINTVKRIEDVASPGEQLNVILDTEKLQQHGVSLENLVRQLQGGNAAVPSGYIQIHDKKVSVLTNSFYKSQLELSRFPIILNSGLTLPLAEFGQISRSEQTPKIETMRYNGQLSMALGVVAKNGIKLQDLGEEVRRVVREFQENEEVKASGIKIEEISYQPRYVEERIREIMLDLAKAIVLVGGVLMLMLGFRVGSIVALQVPFVTAIAFGFFSHGGGVLNQISIAAFILAIGLLVDNVVVIVDGIQSKLDEGLPPIQAGEETRKEYLIPLAAGTLTTISAFLPIMLSKGVTADFTRAIGTVATIALACSYFFCILVTPILASRLLKKGGARQWTFVNPLGAKLGALVNKYPKAIVLCGGFAVAIAALSFRMIPEQFFPFADRDLLIVEMKLPEGTHFRSTESQADLIESAILQDKRVVAVSSFVGRGVPQFYYNLPRIPNAPHVAQFIVRTHNASEAKSFKRDRERDLAELAPFANVIVKEIAQGPPVKATIEVRVLSHDPLKLQSAAHRILAAVREADGTANVRSTLGVGAMNLRLDVNDAAAGTYGVTRAEVSSVVLANTRGIPITTFRGGRDPYSIMLMSKSGENSTLRDIESAYMGSTRTESLSIGLLTNQSFEFSPTLIEHYNRVPYVSIFAELAPGAAEGTATMNVKSALEKLGTLEDVEVQIGGAKAESASASRAIFMALPFGLFVLFVSLMFEFNSFRRVGIILLTIPLCAVGTVPGLLLSHSTFGFMTLLGFFTLAGTVIHNGIFLLDYMDHRIHAGIDLEQALTEGIQRRMRPILLTAIATIVELLPMTLSSSTLWPPFAWAIISGLAVSTLMTLLVIPAVYKLAFAPPGGGRLSLPAHMIPWLCFVGMSFLIGADLQAATRNERAITLQELISRVAKGPDASAARFEAEAARSTAKAVWSEVYMPKVTGLGQYSRMDRELGVVTPFGVLGDSQRQSMFGILNIDQPLLNIAQSRASAAANAAMEASELKTAYDVKAAQSRALSYFLNALELRSKRQALEDYIRNLKAREVEIRRLYQLGGVSEADLLKIKLGIDDATQGVRELKQKETFLNMMIAQSVGEEEAMHPVDLPSRLPMLSMQRQLASGVHREDIQALEKQMEATQTESAAIKAATLPSVAAFANYVTSDQELLNHKHWMSLGIRITWLIFDSGTTSSQASALLARKSALENQRNSAQTALRAELKDSIEALRIKYLEFSEREAAAKEAEDVSAIEFRRLRAGKVTVNNVIDAEDLLKDRREKAIASKIQWYKEWFRFQFVSGAEIRAP